MVSTKRSGSRKKAADPKDLKGKTPRTSSKSGSATATRGKVPAQASFKSTKSTPKTRHGAARDSPLPSVWIAGTLAVVDGQIGMLTANGFVALQAVVDSGQVVGLVFSPTAGNKSASVQDLLDKLTAFITEFGVGSVVGGVTTCFFNP
jgi:hypothetical protein